MKTIRLLLAVGLVAAGLCQTARGEGELKPIAEINNKSIEANVTIDAELKAYPKLYANLVASGKREMAKWAAEAEQKRKTNPDEFTGDRRWYFDRGYSLRSVVGGYVSIVRDDDTYGSGAHPITTSTRFCGMQRQTSSSTSARSSPKPRKAARPYARWPRRSARRSPPKRRRATSPSTIPKPIWSSLR